MLGCTLQNCVSRNLVVEDHRTPTCWLPLGADNGAETNLTALFQDFKQNLHFTLVCNRVQQEVIQNEQSSTTDLLQSFLVLGIILRLERHQSFQKSFAMVVFHLVVIAGSNAKCLSLTFITLLITVNFCCADTTIMRDSWATSSACR